jgi:hypothetical protein
LNVAGTDHARLQQGWRLLTQPFIWALFALLTWALLSVVQPVWTRAHRSSNY